MIFCTYLKAIFIKNLLKSSMILIPWSLIPPNGTRLSCYCCYILTAKTPHNGGAWMVVILYIWILCNNELYWRIFCISPSEVDDMLFYYSWLFSYDQTIHDYFLMIILHISILHVFVCFLWDIKLIIVWLMLLVEVCMTLVNLISSWQLEAV